MEASVNFNQEPADSASMGFDCGDDYPALAKHVEAVVRVL